MGALGDIGKGAISIVVEENIVIDPRHVKIGPSIVVEVSGRGANAISHAAHSSLLRHISKRAVVIVAIEPIGKTRICFVKTRKRGAIGEINVEISVIVVVEQ